MQEKEHRQDCFMDVLTAFLAKHHIEMKKVLLFSFYTDLWIGVNIMSKEMVRYE